MKRDMDLVRKIALALEELPAGELLRSIEGVENNAFVAHVIWMKEAQLVDAVVSQSMDLTVSSAIAFRLTWAGCEFADAVRDNKLWAKAKDTVLKPSMSFTFDVLKDWLKTEIREGLPTVRALAQ